MLELRRRAPGPDRKRGFPLSIWHRQPDPESLDSRSPGTLAEALGIRFTRVGEDWLEASMPVDERTRQPFGLLHGGASVALAETLASVAANAVLDTTRRVAVGLEINANHVRSVRHGLVTGKARPVHLGSRTQVWNVEIREERDRLTCVSRVTMAVADRDEFAGG